jgi:3-phenylpropionate/trans-cinnamate dioxygenase ferredoxin subunit
MPITIRLKRNGPYVIAAEEAESVVIVDADGNVCVPEAGRSIALCRCGGSATKPFCDKSHRRLGFCDPEAPPASTLESGSPAP